MITLANPFLGITAFALAIAILVVKNELHKRKKIAAPSLAYSQTSQAKELLTAALGQSPKDASVFILSALRILGFLALALGLARPQKVTSTQTESLYGVDIMLALDTSTSMQAIDFDPLNRMQATKKIAREFAAKRKNDRVGIVAFGGAAILACPPTLDREAVLGFLDQVDIGMTKTDGTAIGSGLMTALLHIKKLPSKSKTVILLTDGRNNAGSVDPLTAAKTAQALGVKVYAIGAGKRGGGIFVVPDPLLGTRRVKIPEEEIDEETLTKIAETTGGKYFRATELNELRAIFEEIDQLEKSEMEPPKIFHYDELYPIALMLALFFLGVETLLRGTLFFSIP